MESKQVSLSCVDICFAPSFSSTSFLTILCQRLPLLLQVDCFGQDACAVDLMATTDRLRSHDPTDVNAAMVLDAILEADERGIRAARKGQAPSPGTRHHLYSHSSWCILTN